MKKKTKIKQQKKTKKRKLLTVTLKGLVMDLLISFVFV